MNIPEITAEELRKLKQESTDFILLDVREKSEFEEKNLGGYLIPLGELPNRINELDRDEQIVVHCKSGGRSARAVTFLIEKGFKNVSNLQGGIEAWQSENNS